VRTRISKMIAKSCKRIGLLSAALLSWGTSSFAQNNTIFGPNVYVFTPNNSVSSINSTLTALGGYAQFDTRRVAVLFAPGTYTGVEGQVGYYESVAGLGQTPSDVNINQGYIEMSGTILNSDLFTFWRSMENMEINTPGAGPLYWAVSQGASLRRLLINSPVELADPTCHEGSGGFMANIKITGQVDSCGTQGQQQWYTRNSAIGGWTSGYRDMVFSSVSGAPEQSNPFGIGDNSYVVLSTTPVSREKPFLYVDSSGNYWVFSPTYTTNTSGVTWANGGVGSGEVGTSLPISSFLIATPSTSLDTINAALASGKSLILTPGIYEYNGSISVTNPNTVVLALGYADIIPQAGTAALTVADVDGVQLAGFLIDAGPVNSPVLLQLGVKGAPRASHATNPTTISDVHLRIGGTFLGSCGVATEIDSDNVIIDNMWSWRADHGNGVGWTLNVSQSGLVVNGDSVLAMGLAVEHHEGRQVEWNGENGETIFYQSEMPYDPPSQSAWNDGNVEGYASYNVAPTVATHTAYGLTVLDIFTQGIYITANSSIAAPVAAGVTFHDLVDANIITGQINYNIASNNGTSDNGGTTVGTGSNISFVTSWGGKNGNCGSAPGTPGTPSETVTSASTISVAWGASSEGSNCTLSYNLFRGTVSGFAPSPGNMIASDLTATSFADAGLEAGTTYYYVVQAVNAAGASAFSGQGSGSITSGTIFEGPYSGTPAAIPGTVKAENYDIGGQGIAYNVTSINGTNNSYRPDGVDLETTTVTGGGNDLGWTSSGQWFRYTVNAATSGIYKVVFMVAAPSAVTDAFHLSNSLGINLTGSVNLPATGSFQSWTTVTATVALPAGQQVLTLGQDNGGWNIDSATFVLPEAPYASPVILPGTVLAENYDVGGQGIGYNIRSVNGTDNSYRFDGVDLETTSAPGGGNDISWTSSGQWFKYTVNVVSAGTYTVSFTVAAPNAITDAFHLTNASGANLTGLINIPATGGLQNWTTVTATVTLAAGKQVLTLNEDNAEWNIYSTVFVLPGGPYGGTPAAIPGTVLAANYDLGGQGVGYSANSLNGSDNSYRIDSIDLEKTEAPGGGDDIGWTGGNQWFNYTVNVATAGTYNVTFVVAAPGAVTDGFHLANSAGTNMTGVINVPVTGGDQNWATVTATLTLPAGRQVLTLDEDNGGWNIYSATFALVSVVESPFGGAPAAIPGTVMAENYDTGGQGVAYNVTSTNGTGNAYRSDGVDLETATAPAIGNDLGWTGAAQWFKYTVNVATAGTYKVSFLVAGDVAVTDAFHLANSSGTNLTGSVAVPSTGGWQEWTTVTATIILPAGTQTLTLDEDNGGWNIDSIAFVLASGGEAPYGGTPAAIPGTVMAENYDTGGSGVAYNVTSSNGTDNGYRITGDGVDLETATAPATGNDLGWTGAGQWFCYTVNVATAGTYKVSFLVAGNVAVTDAFHLSNSGGTNLTGSIAVPATDGWQNWTTVTVTVTLPAGLQTLTLDEDNAGWNIDSAAFSKQ